MIESSCCRFVGSTAFSTFVALAAALVLTAGPAQTVEGAAPTSLEKQLESQKTGREPTGAAPSAEPAEHRRVAEARGTSAVPA
jgi:hypothetical protein